MHCGYIVKIEKLRPHSNADKLQIATFFGNDTCVSLDTQLGDIGVYFPSGLQLSEEFCAQNNLVRKKDDAGNEIGGYMDPKKRNVTTIRLRGEKSDGIYLPITCFDYLYPSNKPDVPIINLSVGDTVTVVNGHEICCKYVPRRNIAQYNKERYGSKVPRIKIPVAPLFQEHKDTEQLAYNLDAFKPGDEIEITLKMHGTSQRTGYLPVLRGYKRTLLDRILRRQGTPIYDWGYVSGTRRTVLENYDGGYYGSNEFREQHSKLFEGKLWKGETVYYEVVGFTHTGVPIMGNGKNSKLGKDFVKKYGAETIFAYGCEPHPFNTKLEYNHPQSDVYIYRMTMTNEDGDVVEYTPDFMRYRCEQMGVKTVPVFEKFTIGDLRTCSNDDYDVYTTSPEDVIKIAEEYYDGPDPIGKTHIREGVVVRILNRPSFKAYKHKNFEFKVLEGIIAEAIADSNSEVVESALEEM